MTFSLHAAVVPSNIQILNSVAGLIDKAGAFAAERGIDEATIVDWKLAPDMLPFGYQVKSCAVHSVGGIEGVRAGSFSPNMDAWPTDLAGLRAIVDQAVDRLEGIDPLAFDALATSDTHFQFGETKLPFTGAEFLLSFSQPNFYFHATTAYAILRAQGVKLGKRDFLGQVRLKR